MKTFTELLPQFPNNQTILDTVAKTIDHIQDGKKIMVSVSGGSDSDIMVDLFERIGYEPGQVVYVWFDTGLEYEATKRHLVYLEEKYGIEIQRHKAKMPIPLAVKQFGVPFISKEVSEKFERLQKKNFEYEDAPYEELMEKYERAKAGLKWWCSDARETRFTINALAGLKQFAMQNHPLRPIFFWSDADKKEYEDFCGVVHSDCYTVYGMKRTGCAGCPFNSRWEEELEVIKQYEPKLYKAACNIFGPSYEYTRKYRAFKESWKREKRRGGQIDLFDNWEDLI